MLDHAAAANQASRAQPSGSPVTIFEWTERLSFLLTVGYLTREQAGALHDWFEQQGAMPLPDLPGPEGVSGPRMYEMLTTRIHFGPRGATKGPENIFEDFASAVAGVIDSVVSSTIDVLSAGTALLQAGTDLLHEVHEILQAS
jgi:hypothetical protein